MARLLLPGDIGVVTEPAVLKHSAYLSTSEVPSALTTGTRTLGFRCTRSARFNETGWAAPRLPLTPTRQDFSRG